MAVDPGSPSWTTTGALSLPRTNFGLVLLPDGTVLADAGPAMAERTTRKRGLWEATGTMVEGRDWPTTTMLNDGRVLVAGGGHGEDRVASAEIYDPETGEWTTTGRLVEVRRQAVTNLLADGQVLEVGGGDAYELTAETYDPVSGDWTSTAPMRRRRSPSVTLLEDGQVLVAGGFGTGPGTGTESSAEIYDPATPAGRRPRRWPSTASRA